MSLYAIADLHLSLSSNKPMDIFKGWNNYIESLKKELDQYYDISSLNFKFNLNWSFESDPDYEW